MEPRLADLGASTDAGAEFGVAVGKGSFEEVWGEFTTEIISFSVIAWLIKNEVRAVHRQTVLSNDPEKS